MFSNLSDKLDLAFKKIRGRASLSEKDVQEAMRAVRMALLEADVNYKVTKDFCDRVAAKATGEAILKSLKPDQQVIKIVHEELKQTLGEQAADLNLTGTPPQVIMLVGLQGSGKTTSCGKLAVYLKKEQKRNPYLVPADVYRPAAIDQLKTIGKQIGVPVFDSNTEQNPVDIAKLALEEARLRGHDVMILDTAGRLQIDEKLMQELHDIKNAIQPTEILLVGDAMTGQEAVNVAEGFNKQLEISGLILTKLDGDARGGAALSMLSVTGKPIKFIGLGEKLNALEVFHPDRLASRILGMGDVLSLVEKASKQVSEAEALKMHKKLRKNELTLADFLKQLRMMKKMGSISSLMGMIPGMGKLAKQIDPQETEKELKKTEAIILSMTPKERFNPAVINGSRRKRIANGSGTKVNDVNKLLKSFTEMKKMMKKLNQGGGMEKMMQALGGGGNPMQMLKGLR